MLLKDFKNIIIFTCRLALVHGGRVSCLQPSEPVWYDWSLALVHGGRVSCLQPSEPVWYDWSSAARGASRRAQPRGSASRCIGAIILYIYGGNKTCSNAGLKGHWTSIYLFISSSIEDLKSNQYRKKSADSVNALSFYEVFCEQHHLQRAPQATVLSIY